jgi:hypothetical protein
VTDGPPTVRDDLLGSLLRELDVPEHRPEFYAELHYRLAEERRLRSAEERQRRRARRQRVRWAARTAFVAAAAGTAALVVGLPGGDRGPDVATAAEIKAKVSSAFTSVDALSGEIVFHGSSYRNAYGWEGPKRWAFAVTARGDVRLTESGGADDMAYDAARGVERSLNTSASIGGDELFAAERRGLAPGPPDQGPSDSFLQRNYGAVVRALLAADDPRVRETTYGDQPAWQLTVDVQPNAIVPELSGDRFDITIDQETGFPLRIVELKQGEVLDEIRIEELDVDPPLERDAFVVEFPPNAEVSRTDGGFRRVELAEVEAIVGYAPLVPSSVPTGYGLTEVAVATRSAATGVEAANPPSRMVVSLAYRRGLERFVVTTRLSRVAAPGEPARTPEELWGDPLGTGEGYRDEPERVVLSRGALAGTEAELLIAPRNTPHIWALTDDLVITIAGDLSRAELLAVAESLAAR